MDLSVHSTPATPAPTLPLALLVDGENLSADFAQAILKKARDFGVPTVRRVYGKAEHIARWAEEGFRPIMVRPGKNGADILLSIEATSLALREEFHTLMIAAADHDFTHVTEHLRELGHEIIGIGDGKTPSTFRLACTEFIELEPGVPPTKEITPKIPVTKLVPMVREVLSNATAEGGWSTATWIGVGLKRQVEGFDLSHYSDRSLEATLLALKAFETSRSAKGTLVFRWPTPAGVNPHPPHTVPGTAPPPPAPSFARPRA